MLIPGLVLFSVCGDVQSSVLFLAAPSLISISHIDVAKPVNVTVMRQYAFPVGKNNIFIPVKTGDPGFT